MFIYFYVNIPVLRLRCTHSTILAKNSEGYIFGSMEAPSKDFLLFFLLPDCLKLNHLKSRMECDFSDIFSRHICSTVAETIDVKNYAASFGPKNVQKTTFVAAEMILGPRNQQYTQAIATVFW